MFLIYIIPKNLEASVFINEVAWMGNLSNANSEWIELSNDGSEDVDVSGWSMSGSVTFSIPENKIIVSNGYFLFERSSDNTIPEITADHIYTGALANTGGSLILKDKDGNTIDEINASSGWPAGDNTTKDTMQKLAGSWYTDIPTPKAPTQESAIQNKNNTSTNTTTNNTSSSTSQTTTTNTTKAPVYREKVVKIILNQSTIPQNVLQNFKAEIIGNYGEKIERGNVIWNFGDGKIQEASAFEVVNHKYKYNGEYVLSLRYIENTKDEEGIEVKLNIKVVSSQVAISSIGNIDDPYIEIENKSSYEISLKDWKLIAGGKIFTFPSGTYIKPGRKTIFDSEFLGFTYNDFRVLVLARPGFEIESVYPVSFSENIPINLYKSSYKSYTSQKDVNEKDTNTKDILLDLNSISGQEASVNTPKLDISPVFTFILVLFISIASIFFVKKRKIPQDSGISSLSSSDIKIIE